MHGFGLEVVQRNHSAYNASQRFGDLRVIFVGMMHFAANLVTLYARVEGGGHLSCIAAKHNGASPGRHFLYRHSMSL